VVAMKIFRIPQINITHKQDIISYHKDDHHVLMPCRRGLMELTLLLNITPPSSGLGTFTHVTITTSTVLIAFLLSTDLLADDHLI
jgi:hypothetical protein